MVGALAALATSREEEELRHLFEKFGQVTSFLTKRDWKNSQISFSTTHEAKQANKRRFNFCKVGRVLLEV
jgi:hypothetical protein